ncbi:uncharacterized protein SOCE26_060230 [Sorangium cellulosum]|uniref:Uncharacterized protein n=1 Tax=Sorangium cellulosum TaxID=56 RepID=A0A2L0EZ24_SORCE|nr:uncharacterized protein SOCE26_060230 [Sorangium cellulosum]
MRLCPEGVVMRSDTFAIAIEFGTDSKKTPP